jgi:hypothetical protein
MLSASCAPGIFAVPVDTDSSATRRIVMVAI